LSGSRVLEKLKRFVRIVGHLGIAGQNPLGSRKVAVEWSALRFEPTGKPDRITLDLTRNSVRLAPEYKEGSPVVVLGAPDTTQPASGNASMSRAASSLMVAGDRASRATSRRRVRSASAPNRSSSRSSRAALDFTCSIIKPYGLTIQGPASRNPARKP
jgi:hypothetical protein